MKIYADESVDKPIVDRLRAAGHQILYVTEIHPGSPDEAVLKASADAQLVLLTADKDFGELVYRQRLLHSGVLLIRLPGLLPEEKAELVTKIFDQHGEKLRAGFAVLSPRTLRFRRPPPSLLRH